MERTDLVAIGAQVEVRNRYLGTWSGGFEVAAVHESGYSLRRQCDDTILPALVAFDDVRAAKEAPAVMWSASYVPMMRRRSWK